LLSLELLANIGFPRLQHLNLEDTSPPPYRASDLNTFLNSMPLLSTLQLTYPLSSDGGRGGVATAPSHHELIPQDSVCARTLVAVRGIEDPEVYTYTHCSGLTKMSGLAVLPGFITRLRSLSMKMIDRRWSTTREGLTERLTRLTHLSLALMHEHLSPPPAAPLIAPLPNLQHLSVSYPNPWITEQHVEDLLMSALQQHCPQLRRLKVRLDNQGAKWINVLAEAQRHATLQQFVWLRFDVQIMAIRTVAWVRGWNGKMERRNRLVGE
jgi:hypothetical protein